MNHPQRPEESLASTDAVMYCVFREAASSSLLCPAPPSAPGMAEPKERLAYGAVEGANKETERKRRARALKNAQNPNFKPKTQLMIQKIQDLQRQGEEARARQHSENMSAHGRTNGNVVEGFRATNENLEIMQNNMIDVYKQSQDCIVDKVSERVAKEILALTGGGSSSWQQCPGQLALPKMARLALTDKVRETTSEQPEGTAVVVAQRAEQAAAQPAQAEDSADSSQLSQGPGTNGPPIKKRKLTKEEREKVHEDKKKDQKKAVVERLKTTLNGHMQFMTNKSEDIQAKMSEMAARDSVLETQLQLVQNEDNRNQCKKLYNEKQAKAKQELDALNQKLGERRQKYDLALAKRVENGQGTQLIGDMHMPVYVEETQQQIGEMPRQRPRKGRRQIPRMRPRRGREGFVM